MMDNPFALYTALQWVSVTFYIIATIADTYGTLFSKDRIKKISHFPIAAGLLMHTASIIYWWANTGHGPYISRNEVLNADSWVLIVLFLVFSHFYPRIRAASIIIFPCTFLMMALGIFYAPEITTLTPIFTSIWLIFHISFYKIAVGTIFIAFALSVLVVLRRRALFAWLDRLPSLDTIDIYAYRFAGFGFIFWTIGMLAGSIWAYQSWGRFWGWDPVETWSLITCIVFGIYLHLRRFFGWRQERAAYFFLLCFFSALLSVFILPLTDYSIHSVYFE